jgi:hypothetical protein
MIFLNRTDWYYNIVIWTARYDEQIKFLQKYIFDQLQAP